MSTLLVLLAAVVAVAAAVRSTWSPCGLSMLSTITPLAERGRGRRYGITAAWFVLGAVVGGLTLGAGAAVLAVAVGALSWSVSLSLALAGLAALVTAGSDLESFGRQLPGHPRQVNERWLDQYRAWVYGAGFGWQIGVGLATYIMTAAVYLLIVMAALTASAPVALLLGGLFGLVRGLAILLGIRITSPAALTAFHRRFAELAEPVRLAVVGVQLTVAVVAVAAAGGVVAAAVVAVVAGTLVGLSRRRSTAGSSSGSTVRSERGPVAGDLEPTRP
jgi:MFS family permease